MTKDIVLKPTGAVQIANKFSLIERKLLNGIIWDFQQHRFTMEERSMPLQDALLLVGQQNSRNQEIVKDALRVLASTVIEWNTFGEDKTQEWGVCTFLASAKIVRGKVKYRLNPEIVDKITHPTLFAKIRLLIQSQFRKRHSLVLYEFFVDCMSRRKVARLILDELPLDNIQKLLGLADTRVAEPGNYKFFNRDVLKPSIQEINKSTDVHVTYQPVRKQRKVAALTFTLERQHTPQMSLGLLDREPHGSKLDDAPVLDETQRTLVKQLIGKGVSVGKATELVTKYDVPRIEGNLAVVEREEAAGKTYKNSIAAYLIAAIESDYHACENSIPPDAPAADGQGLDATPPSARDEDRSLQRLRQEFNRQRCQEALSELAQTEREALQREFENNYRGNPMFNKWRDDPDHPVIQSLFRAFASERLLDEPTDAQFQAFVAAKNASEEAISGVHRRRTK